MSWRWGVTNLKFHAVKLLGIIPYCITSVKCQVRWSLWWSSSTGNQKFEPAELTNEEWPLVQSDDSNPTQQSHSAEFFSRLANYEILCHVGNWWVHCRVHKIRTVVSVHFRLTTAHGLLTISLRFTSIRCVCLQLSIGVTWYGEGKGKFPPPILFLPKNTSVIF
jgi:hypothetical protein